MKTTPVIERIARRLIPVPETGCLVWGGSCNGDGYGQVWAGTKTRYVHIVLFELVNGPVPDGLELDHLCRVRACVNPLHLEPVTHRENTLRGYSIAVANAAKTHCSQGHPFDDANTYRRPTGGRSCRSCGVLSSKNYRARKEED